MNRWLWFAVCALGGLLLLLFGLLMPIHLRAVDAAVIKKAGEHPPSLIEHGLVLTMDQATRFDAGITQYAESFLSTVMSAG